MVERKYGKQRLSNFVKVGVWGKNGQWEKFDIYRTSGVQGGHDIEKVMFTSPVMIWIYLEKQQYKGKLRKHNIRMTDI